jgi:hypothetical protein
VLVTSRPGFFEQPELKVANAIDPIKGPRMWTGDSSCTGSRGDWLPGGGAIFWSNGKVGNS